VISRMPQASQQSGVERPPGPLDPPVQVLSLARSQDARNLATSNAPGPAAGIVRRAGASLGAAPDELTPLPDLVALSPLIAWLPS
jgi:hypothetical protein